MTLTTQTPFDRSDVVDLGRNLYRKQILPVGSISYHGRKINFDRKYLADLAQSFKERAFDQVPFQIADGENRHNENPELFRGELKGVDLAEDGLYGTFEVTEDGAKLLSNNPRLGVSARIVEGLTHSDGRSFPRALRHVLGTMDPKVTGLKPWQVVSLSNESDEADTLDLSGCEYESGEDMDPIEEVDLSVQRDLDAIDAAFDLANVAPEEEPEGGAEDDFEVSLEPDDDVDVEDEDEDEDEDYAEDEDDIDPEDIERATNLSRASEFDAAERIAALELELSNQRFNEERRAYIEDGVPPAMVDLARPVLAAPGGSVVDLAGSDERVDLAQIVRGILDEAKGTIDLRREMGHAFEDADSHKTAEEDALLTQWNSRS